jgi:hypothetical protein
MVMVTTLKMSTVGGLRLNDRTQRRVEKGVKGSKPASGAGG